MKLEVNLGAAPRAESRSNLNLQNVGSVERIGPALYEGTLPNSALKPTPGIAAVLPSVRGGRGLEPIPIGHTAPA